MPVDRKSTGISGTFTSRGLARWAFSIAVKAPDIFDPQSGPKIPGDQKKWRIESPWHKAQDDTISVSATEDHITASDRNGAHK